jgi:hypothetical protein
MAIKATFSPSASLLSVFGDNPDDIITVSRDAAGKILVNGGAVSVQGGQPTVANTALIQVFDQGGNDTITLDESNGVLPAVQLFGGAGNDTLTGGSGGDLLFGQAGNDILLGKGGNDQLFGDAGNDVLTGGDGDDQMFGEAGNDRMIWNPSDDSDRMEGGDGTDTAEVNGGNGAEIFTIAANGMRVRFDRVSPAPFSLDISTTEELVVNANGGDDVITAGNGLADPAMPMERVIAAARLAGAHEFILELGEGYDTIVGERGSTLSGGQRQRIAIARALIADPRILIFDEATSALDYESERVIQQNMQEIAKGRTVLVIAHRLSTVRAMDRIVTLEGGRVVEDGTHDALIKTGGRYASLHRLQAGIHEIQ